MHAKAVGFSRQAAGPELLLLEQPLPHAVLSLGIAAVSAT